MMLPLIIAGAVSAAPLPPAPSSAELLAGAEQAIRGGRAQQGSLMISRAIAAGAWGPDLARAQGDLAYANGRYAEALSKYSGLMKTGYSDAALLEAGGIAALKTGDAKRASRFLERAIKSDKASWRAWNALGAIADANSDWVKADQYYGRASELAPTEAGPVNNRGWSLLLRGEWKAAKALFEQAVALDPQSTRAANNLELANAAIAGELPRRREGESEQAYAQRLNDAGVAAELSGDKPRAIAAFTQALNASGTWYKRAANNLEALGTR